MKALILAAGFGTRLTPYTEQLPKALFPVAGVPVLARMIANLKAAGCTAIAINTHHLADQIQDYVERHEFGLPITLSHEPDILGTGGAIRQLADFWDAAPFVVANADIVTDMDLAGVYRRHLTRSGPVTLVLHDRPPFNQVWLDQTDRITGFERFAEGIRPPDQRRLAFTGVHVLDPRILQWIPGSGFCDIIAVYRQMIDAGVPIHAHVASGHYWQDMGTPEQYRDTVMDALAPQAFRSVFGPCRTDHIQRQRLSGDGSDRRWFRLTAGTHRLVAADHGITPVLPGSEVNAFIRIGRHLHRCGLPVPRIVAHDGFSGIVLLDDLGDGHLQQIVCRFTKSSRIEPIYRQVIDTWLDLTVRAAPEFNPDWTCQSRDYDEQLILDKECRYFVDAFLNGYLNLGVSMDDLHGEFALLARRTVASGVSGLIHRDFQSRNIMVQGNRHFLIDFQGARNGPIQYDLASLLIDPYVGLDGDLRHTLLTYAAGRAVDRLGCPADQFIRGYRYCAVTRNLQMLGAFGFLSRVKGKLAFEKWIPGAVAMLADHIQLADPEAFPRLLTLAQTVGEHSGCHC